MKPNVLLLQSQELQIYNGPFGSLSMHILAGDHLEPPQGPLVENHCPAFYHSLLIHVV